MSSKRAKILRELLTGNDAIHDLQKFEQKWLSKLDDIVAYTRLALLDLYAQQRGRRRE